MFGTPAGREGRGPCWRRRYEDKPQQQRPGGCLAWTRPSSHAGCRLASSRIGHESDLLGEESEPSDECNDALEKPQEAGKASRFTSILHGPFPSRQLLLCLNSSRRLFPCGVSRPYWPEDFTSQPHSAGMISPGVEIPRSLCARVFNDHRHGELLWRTSGPSIE